MKKTQSNLIAGLDVGSTTIRMAVGQLVSQDEMGSNFELQILGAAEVPSEGINRGTINSIEDLVSSVSACLERTERMVGLPIDSVWTGISGLHIISQPSKGVVAVSKADSEITSEDVTRALEAARTISTPLNYDVLHILPKSFGVDGQTGIKDPVGMTGIRLEVDAQIILSSSSQVKNLTKAIYRAGLEIDDLVLSILATGEAVLTSKQKELGVLVVDLGGSTTSLAVFEGGDIIHTAVLPIGSEHITNDIAIGLRTSIDVAEQAKLKYGDCFSENVSKKDEIDLMELGGAEHEMVKRKYLSEIIEARTEEIIFKIDQELRKINRSGLLPAGVVFTGGGAKLPGLVEMAKKHLRLPATIGYPLNILSVTDKVSDTGFVTVIGLIKWGSLMAGSGVMRSSGQGIFGGVKKVFGNSGKVKSWFKALLP